ncbi:MAG TPA: ROK family protein, partial [Vicinamibacterales bacterium]|nr:ROK family protein [Vicinamibacterales bacterium]
AGGTERAAEAARAGDARARRLFREAGRLLGLGVANIVSLLDPEVVVLGGGLAGAADLFFDELVRTARARSQPLAARRVRIVLSRLGGDAHLIGAARLAWDAAAGRSRA